VTPTIRSTVNRNPDDAIRIPVDWPREAEEKSDQNEKLSERSEFFSFRLFLSIAGKGQSPGSPLLWLLSSGEAEESDSPPGETGAWQTNNIIRRTASP
jgi:hypothetical protein